MRPWFALWAAVVAVLAVVRSAAGGTDAFNAAFNFNSNMSRWYPVTQRPSFAVTSGEKGAPRGKGAPPLDGCARHRAAWSQKPRHTPTTAQVSVADGPLAGNGMLGVVTAPHADAYPPSPPNATALGKQTLWIGSNSFWSANTYGADEAGAAWVPPSGGPFPHCEVPYGMLAVGGVTVDFKAGPKAGEGGSYSALQDLCHASISSTVRSGSSGSGPAFTLSTVVLADDNAILTNVSCAGCSASTVVTVELWVPKGRPPFDQATCGPDNMPRGAYILPTSARAAGAGGGAALVTRASAADGVNSAVLMPCGPYVNDATQNFTLDATTGAVALLGGRCLLRAGHSMAKGATGDKTTVGACGDGPGGDELWTLRRDGRLISGRDGHCLSLIQQPGAAYLDHQDASVYVEVVPCQSAASTVWRFDPLGSDPRSGVLLETGGGLCLTAVEPSWIDDTALAMRVVDARSGAAVRAPLTVVDDTRVRATLDLQPGQTITLVVASLTSFDVHGAAFARDPLRARRLASSAVDPAVINATLSLLESTVARLMATGGASAVVEAHRRSWWEFWNASTIDISTIPVGAAGEVGGDALDGPLALLESNYFGSQYILQSAGRSMGTGNSGRVYQPLLGVSSLFGPFSTGDYIGWNGDVTLNYNAESPLYGVPSSNRAELALPYFELVLSALPLARRRAVRQPWPGGAHHGQPGLPGQQIDEYTIADKGGYTGVNYPGHIGPFGLHDWSDRGQRSNGAFAAVPFIEYYEHVRNTSWLRSTGAPFINEIASFYTDYMTKEEDHGLGTAWMAWPRLLGALPKATFTCPEHTMGGAVPACIVNRRSAGQLCRSIEGCTGIAYTSDDAWNVKFPSACMLTAGAPIASGPAWDVRAWASHYPQPTTAAAGIYTWNVPRSCSMELCALGSFGQTTEQSNPALELPLVRRVLGAALQFSATLFPEPDSVEKSRRAEWRDILDHLAPLPLTTNSRGDWVWAETNISASAAFGVNRWYPLDYFSPMHPGNGVGIRSRTSDPDTFALAQRTVATINEATSWVPESGAQMDWIAAVRLGWNASEFISKASEALGPNSSYPMFPSLYGTDGGGGLETCGVTLAINEMLLQSHEGALRFFPVWPRHHPASFETLRTNGAFLVSAVYSPTEGSISVRVKSTVGGNCTVFAEVVPQVMSHSGVAVVAHAQAGLGDAAWWFATTAGELYTLAMSTNPSPPSAN